MLSLAMIFFFLFLIFDTRECMVSYTEGEFTRMR